VGNGDDVRIESLSDLIIQSLKSMNMLDKAEAMKERTKQFAIRVVAVVRSLPSSREGNVIGNQLLRSGTAVAANYRAVCRARSKAEFVSKMGVVVEEADETVFWLEMLADTAIVPSGKLTLLLKQANELLAICAASVRTAKYNKPAA
jgi:four helix bundle protein